MMGESPQYAYSARNTDGPQDRRPFAQSLAQAFPVSDSGSFTDLLRAIDEASEAHSAGHGRD